MVDPPFDLGSGPEDFPLPFGDPALIDAVVDHCEQFFGKCAFVWHEVVSEFVHIDLHVFGPDPVTGIQTIVTSGMAEKPMNVPPGVVDGERYRYAELVLQVPATWPVNQQTFDDPEQSWPLMQLKAFARLPHMNETWVWGGHTMASNPPEPFCRSSNLCASAIWPSFLLPHEFECLELSDGRDITFLTLGFLYAEELEFSRKHCQEALLERIERKEIPLERFLILDVDRPNVCSKKSLWSRFRGA